MKIIIDPYRGGTDTGKEISGQYEKNLLLNLSKYMEQKLEELNISSELVRNNDISLTEEERNSIINEIKDKNDIIIQNRISEDNEFDIIYPLRNDDFLASQLTRDLQSNGINVDKYYQRRLPTNTTLDYYSIIRNTKPNETIIIEYLNNDNYEAVVDIIVESLNKYINKKNTYTIIPGDTLYSIAKKFKTTVSEIKKINNLNDNNLSVGQIIKIPEINTKLDNDIETMNNTYTVVSGDTLYSIAKKYNITVEQIKKINNIQSNNLSIGQILNLPTNELETTAYTYYTIQKGDSLYQIAKKYNTTIETIKKINKINSTLLSIGQQLKVPIQKQDFILYNVEKNDTLYQIAKKYNTTVNDIKSLNNLINNTLSIGQELKIPR